MHLLEKVRYLDRRVSSETSGVSATYDGGSDTTTWTLPYAVAVDGSEGSLVVCRQDPPTVYSVTRPAPNQVAVTGQGDLTAVPVYIGITYTFSFKPTRIHLRDENNEAETRGRLTLRYLDVLYADATDFEVVVRTTGRSEQTRTFTAPEPAEGSLRVAIAAHNKDTSIELRNSTPGGAAFRGLDWEGSYTIRSRRM